MSELFVRGKICGPSQTCPQPSSSLVLVVIVDLVIPEQRLVSIAPEEVLRADVLVWVFNSLLQGG
jgi:hypothetical protein